MACVALASLISTIELEFLQPIPRVPLHDDDKATIESFLEMISSLQAFLEESSGGGGATVSAIKDDLEIKIRDFALKAEDDMEILLSNFLLAKDTVYREKVSQELLHQTLKAAAENATELLSIIDNISNEAQPPIHWLKHGSESKNNSDKWDGSSWRSPKFSGRMVGRHRDREVIINWLTSGPSYLKLIPIVGMVGIGKTTLAKSVYGDPKVINSFNVCRWITVPRGCKKSQILRLLLRSISPAAESQIGTVSASEEELVVEVQRHLSGKRLAVAKRLSKCKTILKAWEKIKKEIETLGILDRNALIHNYNQLPQHLKVCFLYLGVFPKRKEVLVKKLIRLWITEGLFKPQPLVYPELENQAYAYLEELIFRSLVLMCSRSSDGKIKSWRMQSALHSFCVGEAHKQGIFCAINTLQHPGLPLNEFGNSCRWLSLCKHSFDYYVLFSTNNLRSIFFFDADLENFTASKLLRVLAYLPSPFLQRVPMHLGDLVFLRYLSVTQWFKGLNDVVSANLNLQTLVVSGSESQLGASTLQLPSTVWELPQLRHLELGNMHTVDPPNVVKRNLQTLAWVAGLSHCKKAMYFSFPSIRKLKIFYKEDLEPDGASSNPIILDTFWYLKRLQKLTVSVSISHTYINTERFLCPLQLKKLRLSGTNLSQRDLTILGMLPELIVLKLENAFRERVWEVAKGGFHKVRFLLLGDKTLKQLTFDEYSFQSLKRLTLRFCYCLEEIPNELLIHPLLESIELDKCNPSVVASAKRIREEQLNYGHKRFELMIDGDEYDEPQLFIHAEESIGDGLSELTVN